MNVLAILKPIVGRMPLYVRLMYMLLSDPAVGTRSKAYLSAGLLYAISPIDLIPGLIPVVGQLDDVIVALSALLKVLKQMPSDRRSDLLSRAGLRIESIESDLEAAKCLAFYFATRPAAYVGHALKWTGKKAGGLVMGCYERLRVRRR